MSRQIDRFEAPWARRRYVWGPTLIAGLLAAAAILLWWFDPGQLALPVCAFHAATGLYCPGCGATRATHEFLHGRWLSALQHNALWILALPLVVYGAASEIRACVTGRPLPGDLPRNPWLVAVAVTAAVVYSILRNIPVWPFVLLAPPG